MFYHLKKSVEKKTNLIIIIIIIIGHQAARVKIIMNGAFFKCKAILFSCFKSKWQNHKMLFLNVFHLHGCAKSYNCYAENTISDNILYLSLWIVFIFVLFIYFLKIQLNELFICVMILTARHFYLKLFFFAILFISQLVFSWSISTLNIYTFWTFYRITKFCFYSCPFVIDCVAHVANRVKSHIY